MLGQALRAAALADKDLYRSNVVAQLAGEGSNGSTTITDSSSLAANWTAVGTASVSTAQFKFGSSSLIFGGQGNYITPTNTSDYAFPSDFTVEMWLFPTTLGSNNRIIYDCRPELTNGAYMNLYISPTTNALIFSTQSADRITGSTALTLNSWQHVALCRSGTNTRLFLNGTQEGSTYSDTNSYLSATAGRPRIGNNAFISNANNFIGHIDDIRITKGVARYTANFTPPTSAFPARG